MLKRRRPLDETADTLELLERELENGVQIEWVTSDRSRRADDHIQAFGILVVHPEVTTT